MKAEQFYVYIMTSKTGAVLYTGVTNNLRRRVYEHKQKLIDGFTKKYNVVKLVFTKCSEIVRALSKEKNKSKTDPGGKRRN